MAALTRNQNLALFATILGSGIVFLDGTVVNIALPHIQTALHAGLSDLQWIVDGYLLSLSALILLGGSMGDIFGRKRIYMIGLAGFGVVSLLSGLSPTVGILIALRILQGVFGALLVPGALAIINTNFPDELRGLAIGRWTAWSAITTAIGPVVGGYIVDHFAWNWVFLINVPLIAICAVLAQAGIVETKEERKRRIDFSGAGAAILGLAGVTYGLIEGPVSHWNHTTVAAIVAGVFLLIVFGLIERAKKDPMMDLSLFKSRNFSGTNLATFAMYGALSGFFFGLVIYLQTTVKLSGLAAGSALLPVTIVLLLLSSRVGALSAKYGSRLFMTIGPIIASLGILFLYRLHFGSSYWFEVMPGVIIFALGLAITVAPLTTTVMSSVSKSHSGIASAINNAVSRVAGLVVVAVLGILGAAHLYQTTILLCFALAFLAGVISFVTIRNEKTS